MNIGSQTRKIVIWILLAESMLILSTRLGAFLHEFVGHGLMAEFFGGKFEAFQLTLFAGGKAQFTGDFSELAYLWISLGGIVVNLITGFVVLRYIQKRRLSFSFTLFGLFLSGVSIFSQLQYVILGAYYQYGDPACLARYPLASSLSWMGGLVCLAFFSWFFMRFFFAFQNVYFPTPQVINRAILSLLILGIPVILYTGFYYCARTPLGSTAAIQEAHVRAQKKAEHIKTETGSEKSLEEIRKEIEPTPILPWILAIYFLSTSLAFFQPALDLDDAKKNFPPFPCSFLYILPWGIASGFVLILIAFLW